MKINTYNNLKGTLILCTASLIWGLAFVAQNSAADLVPPLLFNALRSLIGAGVLCLYNMFRTLPKGESLLGKTPPERRSLLKAGVLCGILLCLSVNLQQFGIAAYPDGASVEARGGFLTALYVILVPIFAAVFGKKISPLGWIAALVAVVGFYFLCMVGDSGTVYVADLLELACAVSFTFHILAIDRLGAGVDGAKLSMIQFTVCGVLSGILSLCFEQASVQNVLAAWFEILFLGIMSSGIAYTLQIVGQKYSEPGVASIAMSLESVFAALGGWVIMGNALNLFEIIGCLLVFGAIILAQVPEILSTKRNQVKTQ